MSEVSHSSSVVAVSSLHTAVRGICWIWTLLAALCLSLVLALLVRRIEDRSAVDEFHVAAEARLSLFDASLRQAMDSMDIVGGLFKASTGIDRRQFARLTQPVLARQPALQSLEWVPLTQIGRLASLRAEATHSGLQDFDVRELGEDGHMHAALPRAEYFPVWFVEPVSGNQRAFGFDLGSNQACFLALDAARRQGRLTATAPVRLTQQGALGQEASDGFAVLLFRPVYGSLPGRPDGARQDGAPDPLADPSALRGFVVGVVRIAGMLGPDGGDSSHPVSLYLSDPEDHAGEQRLLPATPAIAGLGDLPGDPSVERRFEVGGRHWLVSARPTPGRYRVDHFSSEIAVFGGLLMSLLLGLLQFRSNFRTRAIAESVEQRTAELCASERRLIQLNQDAIQASRAKTLFLASMTHEFRTPMNAILGLLHVLGRSPLQPQQRDHVDKISSAARRLLRLIEDILDASRIEAGKLSVERHPFQLEAILRDVVVAVTPRLRDKPLELVIDLDPDLPAELIGDAMRLTQVLVNLGENAAKFAQTGHVLIALRVARSVARRIDLEVEVRDSGPGMSAEARARLFKPFAQADASTSRRYGGSGLGLVICHQLVHLMGGEISVQSVPGVGSSFRFTLPMGVTASRRILMPGEGVVAPRVLLLETHDCAAASLVRMLDALAVPVHRIGRPEQLRLALQQQRFDLVLVAQGFPQQAALEALLAGERGLRVVELAASGAALRDAGRLPVFEKPLLPSQLLQLLDPLTTAVAPLAPGGHADPQRSPLIDLMRAVVPAASTDPC